MGFHDKKLRRLRRFRFLGRAKVYLMVRWPMLVCIPLQLNLAARNDYYDVIMHSKAHCTIKRCSPLLQQDLIMDAERLL